MIKGKLTDKAIERYREKGWYAPEFREARRELMKNKQAKREKRSGNFLIRQDGSRVYSPR